MCQGSGGSRSALSKRPTAQRYHGSVGWRSIWPLWWLALAAGCNEPASPAGEEYDVFPNLPPEQLVWGPCDISGYPCPDGTECDFSSIYGGPGDFDDTICRPSCEMGSDCSGPHGENLGPCPASGLCYLACDVDAPAFETEPCLGFLADHPATEWANVSGIEPRPRCGPSHGSELCDDTDGDLGCWGQCTWWCRDSCNY
jgi:hypothetical protein